MLPIIVEVQKFGPNAAIEPVQVLTARKVATVVAEWYTVIILHFPDRCGYREEETHKAVCY